MNCTRFVRREEGRRKLKGEREKLTEVWKKGRRVEEKENIFFTNVLLRKKVFTTFF